MPVPTVGRGRCLYHSMRGEGLATYYGIMHCTPCIGTELSRWIEGRGQRVGGGGAVDCYWRAGS